MVLADIGEIGVYAEGAEKGRLLFILRPSLYAISRLGEPADIVAIYAFLMSDPMSQAHAHEQFRLALGVIYACTPDNADPGPVFGYFEPDASSMPTSLTVWPPARMTEKYVMGKARIGDILPLARSLLKHGVTGAMPPLEYKPGNEPEYTQEFHAREHVALAMAHLGVSERDAWRMTMTSLVAGLRAKFPQQEAQGTGAKAPTKSEHEATMARFDKIDAKRKAKAGK